MDDSSRIVGSGSIEILGPADQAPRAVWRWLSQRETEPWLDEIGALRAEQDDLDRSLDIWSIALIAALSAPERREAASRVMARLRKLSDTMDASSRDAR
jgi:hypothetical protein